MLALTAFFHIATGALAVLCGAIAAITRKGGGTHILWGQGFVALMTVSSLIGAGLGLIRFEDFFITFFAGLLAAYLVLTGWLTANRSAAGLGPSASGLASVNAATFAALVTLGARALSNPDGTMFGFAGEHYLFLAGMSGVGLLCDASLMFRKQLSSKSRIARHLWRMSLGFFIAAGSAFTGPGASAFPEFLRNTGVLALPELLILLMMVFYLIRVSFFSPIRPREPSSLARQTE